MLTVTLRDEESGWSERPLSWYSVQLSSFPNGRSAYVTSCRWFPDAVCCRRCSESAEECLLCVHRRLWTPHNVHSPWQIYGGAEFLAHGWNSLHRPSSAIVFALQLLRRMFKNTYREDLVHCSLPGTEVKCQPVDKLCKNVSRGKLTKTSILWTVRRIRLHWSINTGGTGCTCTPVVHSVVHSVVHIHQLAGCESVKHTSGWRIHFPLLGTNELLQVVFL